MVALEAISSHDQDGAEQLECLRNLCREIAEPYARNRADRFPEVEGMSNWTYRRACFASVAEAFPLVIADEALRLYTYNQDLSQELGVFVIRHR